MTTTMNITTLAGIIQKNYIQDAGSGQQSLQLPATNDLNSTDIQNLIQTYLSGATLTLTKITQSPPTQTTYTITGTFTLNGKQLQATAVFYLVNTSTDGTPEITLTLTLPASGWTFDQSFPLFADQVIALLAFDNPLFVLESYTKDGTGQYPTAVNGFNFIGAVDTSNSAPLSVAEWLLSGGNTWLLSGTLTDVLNSNKAPQVNLSTPLTPSAYSFGSVNLLTGVGATSTYLQPGPGSPFKTPTLSTDAALIAQLVIGSGTNPINVPLSMSLPASTDSTLTFKVSLDEVAVTGLSDFANLVGTDLGSFMVSQYQIGNHFALDEMSIVVAPAIKTIPSMSMGMQLKNLSWNIIPGFLELLNISLRFFVTNPLQPQSSNITANFAATFLVADEFDVMVSINLPALTIHAYLAPGDTIPIVKLFEHFVGQIPLPDDSMTITKLDLLADPLQKSYSLSAEILENLSLDLGITTITLEYVKLEFDYDQNSFGALFYAYLNFLQTDFYVSAQKPEGGAGWIFSGGMAAGQTLSLESLAKQLLPSSWSITLPASLQGLTLVKLDASFNTADNTFSFDAGIDWKITDLIPNKTLEIDASVSLQSSRAGDKNSPATYSGSVEGDFQVGSLKLTAIYQFASSSTTLTFKMDFKGVDVIATLTTKKGATPAQDEKILQISLGDLNFGEIVEFLINLADPSADFKLSSPWDVLNDISFNGLTLNINLTKDTVGIEYPLKKNLVIIDIDTIWLTYTKQNGSGTVMAQFSGQFLGQTYSSTNPLQWDMLNDPPPATPGKGAALLDLQYLGLGQHISLDTQNLNTVEDVINALESIAQPVTDESKNPLKQLSGLAFDQNSHWFIGTSFTVMGTFSLSAVFDDPNLYGLLVSLAGDKAGTFAGLKFEILYKKVTDTIGVYHIELKLPDALRNLQFGEVSITLPIIVIDIYTNGNFRIDFGFPWNGDFSRSFSVQVFPFVGYGGFYFALLSGDTSTSVPKISNGNFNPVIEFGVGLSLGVGKTINEGVLQAGISVTVEGIIQGVIGWFNPNDSSVKSDRYYWIQGTITIVGKVYGIIDFKIITINISIVAYASVTLTIQAYEPILIAMSAGVSVSASIKILFITIHFSFSMTIHASFTIGSQSTPPWNVISPAKPPQPSLSAGASIKRISSATSARPSRMLMAALAVAEVSPAISLQWTPVPQLNSQPQPAPMFVLPAFTVAVPEGETNPQVEIVALIFAENSIDPAAQTAQEVRAQVAGDAPETAAFNLLVQGMLAWAINALLQNLDGNVTIDDLLCIYNDLNQDATQETAFSYSTLSQFLGANYLIQLSGIDELSSGNQKSATVFPMIPALTLTTPDYSKDFSAQPYVDSTYEQTLENYFNQLMVDYQSNVAQDPLANPPAESGANAPGDDTNESMATVIFRDYFVMLAKSAVQSGIDLLRDYPYDVQNNDSLQSIINSFPRDINYIVNEDYWQTQAPDTLESIAAYFQVTAQTIVYQNQNTDFTKPLATGTVLKVKECDYTVQKPLTVDDVAAYFRMPTEDITVLNPGIDFTQPLAVGTVLKITVALTPDAIGEANQSQNLAQGTVLPISGVKYQVKNGDTLGGIATQFGFTDASSIVGLPDNGNSTDLLQPQSLMNIDGLTYTTVQGDSLDLIAAYFYMRNLETMASLNQALFAQTIINMNAGVDFTQALAVGSTLQIPQYVTTTQGYSQSSTNIAYQVATGDTLSSIASNFLSKSPVSGSDADLSWMKQTIVSLNESAGLDWNNLPAGQTIQIPQAQYSDQGIVPEGTSFPYNTRPGDTLELIAGYFLLTQVRQGNLAAIESGISSLNTGVNFSNLTVGQSINIPQLQHLVQTTDSLNFIAGQMGTTASALSSANSNNTTLLAALAVLSLPLINYTTTGKESLSSLAAAYNLSVAELSRQVAPVQNLFPTQQTENNQTVPVTITIPHLPVIAVSDLLSCVVTEGHANNVAASVSRFMLSGLRVPDPSVVNSSASAATDTEVKVHPLYLMTGQQFTAPPSSTNEYDLTFTNTGAVNWVEFASTSNASQGGDDKGGANNQDNPPTELVIKLTSQILQEYYPSTTFDPEIIAGPERLPLLQETPVRYSLSNVIRWQAASLPSFICSGNSTSVTKQPTAWLFPDNLINAIDPNNVIAYELVAGTYTNSASMTIADVECYDWATLLQVNVRKIVADASGTTMPNSYLIDGTDEEGARLLEQVWQHLNDKNNPDSATLYLLYSPCSTSAIPSGLSSDVVDTTQTFILKTNLSTETHSTSLDAPEEFRDAAMPTASESDEFYATIDDAKDFIRLLWEATVVGTGGFYLNYAVQGSGTGLPASLFSQGTEATLWLLVLLNSQSSSSMSEATSGEASTNTLNPRSLYTFNNCVVVEDNLDVSKVNLFAEASEQAQMTQSSTVPQGNMGFLFARKNASTEIPAPPNPEPPDVRTRNLYSLFGFQIAENSFFGGSNEGLPVSPTEGDPSLTGGLALPSYAQPDPNVWSYHQVVPVYKFASLNNIPPCEGLPDNTQNPYAGIGLDGNNQLGQVQFEFDFHDVYGNLMPPATPITQPSMSVGYFDDLMGLSQWPGTTSSYEFASNDGNPLLIFNVSLQLAKYLPGAGNSFENAVRTASAHLTLYKQLYYQVQQRQVVDNEQQYDVTFALLTSLSQPSLDSAPSPYPLGPQQRSSLTNFTSAAYVFLSTACALKPFLHTVGNNESFDTIATNFSVTLDEIGKANENEDLTLMFSTAISLPQFHVVQKGDTLDAIVGQSGISPQTLLGYAQNQSLPLNAGTDMNASGRSYVVKNDGVTDFSPLAITESQFCTFAGLASANPTAPMQQSVELTCQGATLTTGKSDTLSSVVNSFNQALANQNVTVTGADVLAANQKTQMFAATTLSINDYVIQQGDTLAALLSKYSVFQLSDIASSNASGPPDIFPAGTALYLSTQQYQPIPGETLASVANKYDITVEQLSEYNGTTQLANGQPLMIPDLVVMDTNDSTLYSTYEATGSDDISTIAQTFGETPTELVTMNQNMPGLFNSPQSVTVSGYTVPAGDEDTFNTILAALNAQANKAGTTLTLEDLANAIQGSTGLIAAGALFVCPTAKVIKPLNPTKFNSQSLDEQASIYNVTVTGLALANCAVQGFLQEGASVTVSYPATGTNPAVSGSLTVGANDTFNTLVNRFQSEKQITTNISDIATQNQNLGGLLTLGAPFILPPLPANVSQQITAQYPAPIFPITVQLEMTRNQALIDPEFAGVTSVQSNQTTVAPENDDGSESALSLQSFAESFEQAFPGLKAAAGRKQDLDSATTPIFAVNFGTGGTTLFDLQNQKPQFYALKPLSNQLIAMDNVPISTYTSGQPLPAPTPKNFQAIDMDVWASDLFTAVDLFLSPEYAVPAYQLEPTHDSYEAVVAAKADLAEAVKYGVDYILQVTPGQQDANAKEAAREALYQNLLINLSSAYDTDALIQFPVSIESPFTGTNPPPPNLSGKADALMYLTGADDQLSTVATYFNVSPEYTAKVLAGVRRILNITSDGLSLTYSTQTHVFTDPSTSLQDVADYFQASIEKIGKSLQTNNQALFAPNTTINLSGIEKSIASGDSFESLAEYFNISVDDVAWANLYTPGIFAPGTLTVGKKSVTVQAGDTLSKVAGELNMDPIVLAETLMTQPNVLNTGAPVYALQLLPEFALSVAKTPLASGGAPVTFLFSTKEDAEFKKLFLNMNYSVNELEYDIQPGIQDISSYQASSWLTFILPFTSGSTGGGNINVDIGQVEIPIPDRFFPLPPTLVSQSAEAANPGATTVEPNKLWYYTMTYERQDAAQDTDYLSVTFNVPPSSGTLATASPEDDSQTQLFTDLFNALAEFNSIYPALKNDLAILLQLQPGQTNDVASNAINIFQQLVTKVAKAWLAYSLPQKTAPTTSLMEQAGTPAQPINLTYNYELEVTVDVADTNDIYLSTLLLKSLSTPAGLPILWPQISVQTTDLNGNVVECVLQNTPPQVGATESVYYYPAPGDNNYKPVLAFGPVQHTLQFGSNQTGPQGLDVAFIENASGGVYIKRNENLVSTGPTNTDFVYQTAVVRFTNVATPLIQNYNSIPINYESDLEDSLNDLFTRLFSADTAKQTHYIRLACRYGYQLVAPSNSNSPGTSQPITSYLPVLFISKQPYTPQETGDDTDNPLVQNIWQFIQAWAKNRPISSQGGSYVFDLSIYSTLDTMSNGNAAQSTIQPLLELKYLSYSLSEE